MTGFNGLFNSICDATTSFLAEPNSVIPRRESRRTIKKYNGPVGDVSNGVPVCDGVYIDSIARFSSGTTKYELKKGAGEESL